MELLVLEQQQQHPNFPLSTANKFPSFLGGGGGGGGGSKREG
jgi:hypothetical protein